MFKKNYLDSDNIRDLEKASKMLRLKRKKDDELRFFIEVCKHELNKRGKDV